MTKKFKLPGWVWVPLLIPLLIGLYFAENIKGQVRFMQYCWNEGGLKVYEPLERDVGWWAENHIKAKYTAHRNHVGFVRFPDAQGNGQEYDIRYIGGNVHNDNSYDVTPADYAQPVFYKPNFSIDKVEGDLRLSKTKHEVYGVDNNALLAGYYVFRYSQFDQDRTPLGVPSRTICPSHSTLIYDRMNEMFIK